MKVKVDELNEMIYSKFKSQAAFSRHIGWPKQRLNKIMIGNKQPTLEEVQTIANGLEVPFMLVANFFLRK